MPIVGLDDSCLSFGPPPCAVPGTSPNHLNPLELWKLRRPSFGRRINQTQIIIGYLPVPLVRLPIVYQYLATPPSLISGLTYFLTLGQDQFHPGSVQIPILLSTNSGLIFRLISVCRWPAITLFSNRIVGRSSSIMSPHPQCPTPFQEAISCTSFLVPHHYHCSRNLWTFLISFLVTSMPISHH